MSYTYTYFLQQRDSTSNLTEDLDIKDCKDDVPLEEFIQKSIDNALTNFKANSMTDLVQKGEDKNEIKTENTKEDEKVMKSYMIYKWY